MCMHVCWRMFIVDLHAAAPAVWLCEASAEVILFERWRLCWTVMITLKKMKVSFGYIPESHWQYCGVTGKETDSVVQQLKKQIKQLLDDAAEAQASWDQKEELHANVVARPPLSCQSKCKCMSNAYSEDCPCRSVSSVCSILYMLS